MASWWREGVGREEKPRVRVSTSESRVKRNSGFGRCFCFWDSLDSAIFAQTLATLAVKRVCCDENPFGRAFSLPVRDWSVLKEDHG